MKTNNFEILKEKGYIESNYNKFLDDSIKYYKKGMHSKDINIVTLNINELDSIPKNNRKYYIKSENIIRIWGTLWKQKL